MRAAPTADASASGGWSPRHVILGGWVDKTDRTVIEDEAQRFELALPGSLQAGCLRPGFPRKHGNMAKAKVSGKIDDAALKIPRWVQDEVAESKEYRRGLLREHKLVRCGAQPGGRRAETRPLRRLRVRQHESWRRCRGSISTPPAPSDTTRSRRRRTTATRRHGDHLGEFRRRCGEVISGGWFTATDRGHHLVRLECQPRALGAGACARAGATTHHPHAGSHEAQGHQVHGAPRSSQLHGCERGEEHGLHHRRRTRLGEVCHRDQRVEALQPGEDYHQPQ